MYFRSIYWFLLHDFQSYIGPDSFIILFIYFNFFFDNELKTRLRDWTHDMDNLYDFRFQVLHSVDINSVSRRDSCLWSKYSVYQKMPCLSIWNWSYLFSAFWFVFGKDSSFITDTSVYINYILSITNFCHKMIPIYSISLCCI